jgi:hypothetical protein
MKRSNKNIYVSEESESDCEIFEVIEDTKVIEDTEDFYDENDIVTAELLDSPLKDARLCTEDVQDILVVDDDDAIECFCDFYFLNYLLIFIFYIIFITI